MGAINSVRNTVMFLLNKDNRGYLTPLEFDYFAKQAQLEVFEGYFHDYERAVAAQNSRKKGLYYADDPRHIQNKIDVFAKRALLNYTNNSPSSVGGVEDHFELPTDFYKVINITFQASDLGRVIQEVPKHRFDLQESSNLTAPSVIFPIYKREGSKIFVRPLSINYATSTPTADEEVYMNYIRKPSDPHWGYNTIDGDPVYNEDSSTQFEVDLADEPELVYKICLMAGLNIREKEVIETMNKIETQDFSKDL